jgi:benzoyl-CoA reductase/2-hydroxyglutaryl-CoA dehydratase subunit BcrC/BadD/HgdB
VPVVQKPIVFVSSPSVPIEIVRAAGCDTQFARGSCEPTPAADAHLEPFIFPNRLRQLVEAALTGRLSHVACIVVPRTSDADYKCFLYLREFVRRGVIPALPPVVLFDLLQSGGAEVRAYDGARTRALCDEVASVSGRTPSVDDLRREIARANAARQAARRLMALRRRHPRISGTEVFALLAAFWEMEPDRYTAMVSEAADAIATRQPLDGPHVLLTGAPVDAPAMHHAIESHGAIVTAELVPWGTGANGDDVRLDDDPLTALADWYRTNTIGARTPVGTLRRWIDERLDDTDAVVVLLPQDDAVFGWDYPALRDRLASLGIPHVCLRGDPYQPPTQSDHVQLASMVAAASRLQEARHG